MAVTQYCPRCGIDRREGERFCRNCGQELGTGAPSSQSADETAGSEPTRPLAVGQPAPGVPPPFAGDPLPPPPPAPPPADQPTVAMPPVYRAPGVHAAVAKPPLPFRPIALAGALGLVISAFLPWTAGAASVNSLDVPLEFLWDLAPSDGPLKLGFAVLAIGLLGGGLSLIPRTAWLRRLLGSFGVAVTVVFAIQLVRLFDGSIGDVFEAVGAGVYVALVGGFALQVSR